MAETILVTIILYQQVIILVHHVGILCHTTVLSFVHSSHYSLTRVTLHELEYYPINYHFKKQINFHFKVRL